ncbi:MAG: DUF222 domain-containing protein [Acidimicrobiia bacterium]
MFGEELAERADRAGAIDRLQAEVAELAGVINAAQGRLVQLVARALSEQLWVQSGVHSPVQWLTWQLGVSSGQAHRYVALARRAEELPATMAACERGALSVDQAAIVARYVPADHEASASELAQECTVRQLTRALRRYSFDPPEPVDPTEERDPEEPEHRVVSFGSTDDGRWRLHADLPLDEGALLEAALTAAHGSLDDGATWADALLAMAEGAMTATEARLPGASRVMIHAHLEAGSLSLHLGSALPSELRRFLSCDANVRAYVEQLGRPVSVGRAMRIVPSRTRRAIEHRDGGCAVPGCSATRFLQIHHVVHWEDGGPSDTGNLVALCRRHHRLHHLGSLGISGDADAGLEFRDARGRLIEPVGKPTPPDHLPTGPPYRHPPGEPLRPNEVYLSPTRAA